MQYASLTFPDLIAASLLIVINGLISVTFRLGLERSLLLSAVRMTVQLGAVGFVLKAVFEHASLGWTLLIALVMITVAGWEAITRQTDRISGVLSAGLTSVTLLAVGLGATLYVTAAVIGSEPWYSPRIFLPILGMILGNALTGIALTLETLVQGAKNNRREIEGRLAMGHERFRAFEDVLRRAMTTALMPIVNAMAVSGIVALPGMMTGQILSGIDPVEAAKYQIMIMFILTGATSIAIVATGLGGVMLLTDERSRLRLDRLSPKT